jgi:Peptidase inhibitor family I36
MAALLLAAVAAAASFALAAPERAKADFDICPEGHFCIWEHAYFKGGMYNSSGSDMDLNNDNFFKTRRRVASRGSAIYNNGQEGPRDDVVIYRNLDDDIDVKDPSFCLREGFRLRSLGGRPWNDNIAGYRWATDRECRAAGRP